MDIFLLGEVVWNEWDVGLTGEKSLDRFCTGARAFSPETMASEF